jgi:hypothetical protein
LLSFFGRGGFVAFAGDFCENGVFVVVLLWCFCGEMRGKRGVETACFCGPKNGTCF